MNDTLDVPDFSKYRYHFRRLWWLPLLLGVLFAFLAGGTSAIGPSQTVSTALLVPAEVQSDFYTPLTEFETSVAVLKSDDTLDVIESQLGYKPNVTIRIDPSQVVSIDARGSSARRATETRDAYVAALRQARAQVIADSIAQAVEDLEGEITALQATVEVIDEELLSAPPESTAALLIGIDRAQTTAQLLGAQRRVATLRALDPSERADVRVESLSAEQGRAVSTGGLILAIGGAVAGLFLGALVVVALAYLDEKVRTRADLVALGVPTFGVLNAAATEVEAPALEAVTAVRRAESISQASPFRLGVLTFGSAAEPAVRQVDDAAHALGYSMPEATRASTPAERLRVAHESDGIIVLMSPGEPRMRDVQLELNSLARTDADLLGVALVAKDARSARRCG